MSKVINAIKTANRPYLAACTAITQFVSRMEGESVPDIGEGDRYSGFAAAQGVFMVVKTDAMHWINQLFPACASLPQAFVNEDTLITGQLNTLISAGGQLAQPGADQNQVRGLIGKTVAGLIPTVQSLQQQSKTLAQALRDCGKAISTGQANCRQLVNKLNIDEKGLGQTISSQAGQLDQARNATCPNQTTINAMAEQLRQCHQQMEEAGSLINFFNDLMPGLTDMHNGLNYLVGFWEACAENGNLARVILAAAASAPASLVEVDLQNTLLQWQKLVAYMKDTA